MLLDKFLQDILVGKYILLMRTVSAGLLLIVVLIIQTNSLQMHHQETAPKLQGSSFQIKKGQFSASNATFSFDESSFKWTQCNLYVCNYSQDGNTVNINNCVKTLAYCGDTIQDSLAQAIGQLKSFKVVDSDYIFSDSQGNEKITFTKV